MLSRLADLLILRPTRNPVFAGGKSRFVVPFRRGQLEVWNERAGSDEGAEPDFFVLNLLATAGRAERCGIHPIDFWPDARAEIWSLNPPGYGESSGRASLQSLADAAQTVFAELKQAAEGRPIIVSGNCAGSTAALHLAVTEDIAALLLRNPLPLRQTILGRFGWCTLGIGALGIADRVPRELDSLKNAALASVPAVFVISGRDRIVPPEYQQQVYAAYRGPKQLLTLPDAGHDDSLKKRDRNAYARKLTWLRERLAPLGSQGSLADATPVTADA
ncbi:MAG: alpha/beta hydrolase [Planctomycetales bacterium]|nr:alpha/beta hydrolase [Planctomycetales bacterium]